jgi:hypothetical protein
MDRLYRVFISSTYTDLIETRQEVMRVLLRQNHIPSGMEAFNAGDEEQWSVIKRVIDLCDYYVVIISNRYGSVLGDGTSYTRREYEYALETKKYIMGFIHDDPGSLKKDADEDNDVTRARLASFVDLVKKKPCGFWKNDHHLGSLVATAMHEAVTQYPREGWIKAGQYDALKAELDAVKRNPPTPAPSPAPVALTITNKKRPESNSRIHHYDLIVTVKNVSKKRLDDWELEFDFPTPLLARAIVYGIQVAEQSDAQRSLFRVSVHERTGTPLRPSEARPVAIQYFVDDDIYDRREDFWPLRVRAQCSVDGVIVAETDRAIETLQNF